MKIKLEWDFDRDEWNVRDEKGDGLGHSSTYNGEYVSVDELEKLQSLLEESRLYVFQFECMAPLYLALTQPHNTESKQESAKAIWKQVEEAKVFREKVNNL